MWAVRGSADRGLKVHAIVENGSLVVASESAQCLRVVAHRRADQAHVRQSCRGWWYALGRCRVSALCANPQIRNDAAEELERLLIFAGVEGVPRGLPELQLNQFVLKPKRSIDYASPTR
jgi:hypothetical protein